MNYHLSVVSFHLSVTFVALPRSTSIPAFWLGVPVSSLLSLRILSPILTSLEFTEVVVPFTVKLPDMVTSPINVPPFCLLTVSVTSKTSVDTMLIKSLVAAAEARTILVPLVAVKSASSSLAPLKNTSTFPGLYASVSVSYTHLTLPTICSV